MNNPILIVDDCKENLENFEELLKLEGYLVVATYDPIEAYAMSKNLHPSLIISDIKMNGMTGFELISLIRSNKETCHIPFIFHSAYSEQSMINIGTRLGASDYIIKPSSLSRLYCAIHHSLTLQTRHCNSQTS